MTSFFENSLITSSTKAALGGGHAGHLDPAFGGGTALRDGKSPALEVPLTLDIVDGAAAVPGADKDQRPPPTATGRVPPFSESLTFAPLVSVTASRALSSGDQVASSKPFTPSS